MQIRQTLNRIPAVVQFVAGLTAIALALFTAYQLFVVGSKNDTADVPPLRVAPTIPPDSKSPDLLLADVNECLIVPLSDGPADTYAEDAISLLVLNTKIINVGVLDFHPDSIWVSAHSDTGLETRQLEYVKDSWEVDLSLRKWVAGETGIYLPLKPSDFGGNDLITVNLKVDSPGTGDDSNVNEHAGDVYDPEAPGELNNETVVEVRLPTEPTDTYGDVAC